MKSKAKVKSSLDNTGSGQQINSYENRPVPYEIIERLEKKVSRLGFTPNCLLGIDGPIRNELPQFEIMTYERMHKDTVACALQFTRYNTGFYDLDKIAATFYPIIEVEPLVINGINTKHLEEIMQSLDWNFEKFRWGKEVEESLNLISLEEDGKGIAAVLWNNIVPAAIMKKPEFIEQAEYDLGIYISKNFPGDVSLEQIHLELKERHLINQSLPAETISDPKMRLSMSELLAKGESLCLHLRTGPADKTMLFLKWDYRSKQIHIYDQGGQKYQAGKDNYFVKTLVFYNKSSGKCFVRGIKTADDELTVQPSKDSLLPRSERLSQNEDALLQKLERNNGKGLKM